MDAQSELTLRKWLSRIEEAGEPSDEILIGFGRMLQGFKLRLSVDEEPFLQIYSWAVALRCVPSLVVVVRALLERWLGDEWEPSLRERAHYNLLHLCIEIGDSQQLGEPIWALYRRRLVSGEYQSFRSVPLTQPLLKAMIRNPSDLSEAADLWKSFLQSAKDGYLDGSPLDGFIGMLYLPEHTSRSRRIRELAMCLLMLHRLKEENLFLNALAELRRAEPSLARVVVERAGLDICDEYMKYVNETGVKAIESTLEELNEAGNQQLAEDFGEKWSKVCVRLEDVLKMSAEERKLRTKPQIEEFLLNLTFSEFDPREATSYRVFSLKVREITSPRGPQSLRSYHVD